MFTKKKLSGFLYFLVVVVILFFLFRYDIYNQLSSDYIISYKEEILLFREKNLLLTIIVFSLCSIIWIFLMGFIFPFIVLAALLFGETYGTLICIISFTIGATLNYSFARFFFEEKVKRFFSQKYPKLRKKFKTNDFTYFFIVRILPGIPFPVKNLSGVIFDISKKRFFFATFLGELPQIYLFVSVFTKFIHSFDNTRRIDLTFIYSPEILIAVIIYLIIIVTTYYFKKKYF